ncbi:hypothetical protein O0L34_g10666 [Tuta absoluta]|nr:hypothetical protein O0L34_g10666 [Tuta absoluta]
MLRAPDIDMQALIKRIQMCAANNLANTNVSAEHLREKSIPLGDIVVANSDFKQKPFFSKTVDGLEVKGYINKVKVLKAKIVYESDEVDVPNFVPVVKCGETRTPKQIQSLAADIVKGLHEEPVLVSALGPTDQGRVIMNNMTLDKGKAFVWPAVCENDEAYTHSGSCKKCRQGWQ